MLGICNGFQALIKLGLVPYGEIRPMDDQCPTLTYNLIGRHQSRYVTTRVASVRSPWMLKSQVGDLHAIPISHGEGRFVAFKAVLEALRGAGIQAMEVFPEKQAMAYSGVVAAVGVGAASGKTAGFCHYLGEMKDPETQAVRERYGKELFGQITVELRANRAADCERGCETATEVLLGGLPEGVRTGELTWEAICWEKTTGMFLRRGVLECRALFLAESAVESGEFLDFRLKGVMSE